MSAIIISTFRSATDTTPRDMDISTVLKTIRTGGKKLRGQIEQIRKRFKFSLALTGDHNKAKKAVEVLKKQLPGVTWSAQLKTRDKNVPLSEKLVAHSGLLAADLDSLGEKLPEVREKLEHDSHVFASFISPSGGGLKVTFRVRADASKHLASFLAVEQRVRELCGVQIDQSRKDVAGLCFLSHDPELYHNPNAIQLEPLRQPDTPQRLLKCKNVEEDRKPDKKQIREMLGVIPERPDYPDWIKVVSAVGDALPDDEAIEVLNEWSKEERPGEYADKLRHRLSDVHIGTLIRLAREHGWTGNLPPVEKPRVQVQSAASANDESTDLTSLSSLGAVEYPAPPDEAAFYGLAGDVVRRIEPHTEADKAALLIQFHGAFGNVVGRTAYAIADGAPHYCTRMSCWLGGPANREKAQV